MFTQYPYSDAGAKTRLGLHGSCFHLCRLEPGPLANAHEWLTFYERFWTARLDLLEQLLREEIAKSPTAAKSPSKGDDQ